jgi:uncharacterized membrane protein YgaE (UPF0421/DUF939 family)
MSKEVKSDFGSFLTRLAKEEASAATQETIKSLQKKMEEEQQAEIERKLRAIYAAIQRNVTELRSVRQREHDIKVAISELEVKANDIIAGKA